MPVLTPQVKREILLNFRSEMKGFQDNKWRERYACYFLPESANERIAMETANGNTDVEARAVTDLSGSTLTLNTAHVLDLVRNGGNLTQEEYIHYNLHRVEDPVQVPAQQSKILIHFRVMRETCRWYHWVMLAAIFLILPLLIAFLVSIAYL